MNMFSGAVFKAGLLACLYIVTGKIGLALAVPPGYATMIWPPSGIALGMLVLYGWRLWPGVLAGSFLLNAHVSGVFSFSDFSLDFSRAGAPFFIAVGSTLQSVAGSLLIRKIIGVPLDLKRTGDVFGIFLIGGPVTCVIASTIGAGTLYFYRLIPAGSFVENWFSWWTGDVFGIVVFLPLVLLFPGGEGPRVRWKGTLFGSLPFLSIVAVVIPLGMTFYLWKMTAEQTWQQADSEFRRLAQENESALRYRMVSYGHALVGGLGYFQNVPDLTRKRWNSYVSVIPLRENYPGINGIGVIYPVPDKDLKSFIARARQDGAPDFSVHPRTQDLPHYVIKYIYPEGDNGPAIGLDIGFEENRRQAAELARDTGYPVITRKILLVQDKSRSPGFLLLYPVYDEAARIRTRDQRRAALRGWVYAPFIAQNFLKSLTIAQGQDFQLRIYDGGEERPENLIYDSGGVKDHVPAYTIRNRIGIMQREWLVVWDSTSDFERKSASREPLIILVWGLFFTGMFSLFLVTFSIRRLTTLEYLVSERAYIFPLLVFGVSFCGTLYLGKVTKDHERHHISTLVDGYAERLSSVIFVDTKEVILALQRLGDRWSVSGGTDKKIWDADTRNYIRDFPSLKTIVRIDRDNYVRWISPLEGLESQVGLNVADTPEKAKDLREAAGNSRILVSAPLTLTRGTKGILVYVPVKAGGRPDGFIVGALSTQQLFSDLLVREQLEAFNLRVNYKGEAVYDTSMSGDEPSPSLEAQKPFSIGDRRFSFTLSPTDAYIESHESHTGILPQTIVVVGFFISLLLSVTTRTILVARIRAAYLKDARIAAEAANDAKSQFLSNISHEIRTPLNGVLTTAELLEKTPLDGRQKKYLDIIRNAGALLFNLLNDVLDLSKIEMHRFELNESPYNLRKTINFTADLFRTAAIQKGLRLNVRISPDLPEYVLGDVHRFSQILSNLIGNAIKYTEKGGIEVHARMQDSEGRPSLRIDVHDTGIGVPEKLLGVIFDRFTQAHETTRIAGTGLGLAICKSLVGLMGGEIGVTSEEGKGSTFWFTLPLRPQSAPTEESAADPVSDGAGVKGCKVLLAEDVEANRVVIADMLSWLGCSVDVAENGQEALECCAGTQYDLIFMDCNMPVMNGYDATRKIRELYGPDVPVVAVSAHAFVQDIRQCHDAGMNDYVQKPVRSADLLRVLNKWARGRAAARDGQDEDSPASSAVSPVAAREESGAEALRFDPSSLQDLTGGDAKKQEKFISMILRNADTLHAEIGEAYESGDPETLRERAHALKSVAAQAGGNALSAVCLQLEKSGVEAGAEDVGSIIMRFEQEYGYFKGILEDLLARARAS